MFCNTLQSRIYKVNDRGIYAMNEDYFICYAWIQLVLIYNLPTFGKFTVKNINSSTNKNIQVSQFVLMDADTSKVFSCHVTCC